MKHLLLIFSFFSLVFISNAQIQQGGAPYSSLYNLEQSSKNTISFPLVNLAQLATEDAIFDLQKDIPYRFGYNFEADFSTENSGEWTVLENGDRIWRISFFSEGAQSLNFLLENYKLAKGASLFFYNENYNTVLGSFTHKNNRLHKNLSTMPIPGDKITLEFYEPASKRNQSTFNVTRVTHGYRSIKIPTKGVGDSGNCNNNVICSVGDNWRDQIRSVGIIIVGGNGNCTGAMVNNTCEDKKPYFLTADHCLGGNVTTWSIGFNWESANCVGNSGFQNISLESVNVLALRANNDGSDFALLELTQTPPLSFGVYYSGWDNSGTNPTSQVGIHHPAGDLKKISFDTDAAGTANWGGAETWHIFDWEDGTTEPGSSGSPLFDQNNRIIGQLYGGTANCNNNIDDYYGRFDVSWDGGTGPANELITWLDECNTGATTINGLDGSIPLDNDVAIQFRNKPSFQSCGVNIPQIIRITNNGNIAKTSITFDYGLVGEEQTYIWTGNLMQGEFEDINLGKLYLCKGTYDYSLNLITNSEGIDQDSDNDSDNFNFNVINGSSLDVEVKTNFQGGETSFEIYNASDELLYSQTSFGNNQSHTFSYCLPFGNYYYTIYDTGGNGLTQTFNFDNGFYTLNIDGVEIQNNDAFGSEETTTFNSKANGIKADFIADDKMANISFDLISNSSGNPAVFKWEAPASTNPIGNSIIYNTSFLNPGTYPILFTITNDTACDFISKNITITKNTVSIETPSFFNESIFPNPAKDVLNISTEQFLNTTVIIHNSLGQEVFKENMNSSLKSIKLSSFSKGMYFVILENDEFHSLKKLIIK